MNSIERRKLSDFQDCSVLTRRKLCSILGKTPFLKRQLMNYHPNGLHQSGHMLALLNSGMSICATALVCQMSSMESRCPSGEARESVSLEGKI